MENQAVAVNAELRRRHFEIEIDEELMKVLSQQAQERGVAVRQLVSDLLREKIRPAA